MTMSRSEKLKEELRSILLDQTRLLDHLIRNLVQLDSSDAELREVADTIILMLQSVGVSIHSILRLTESIDMAIKDCFGISRTVSEMSINVAYIAASDVEVARRAKAHAFQKQFRDLERLSTTADVEIGVASNSVPSASDIPGMSEALEMFTDKKGKEIRDWAADSLDNRIRKVEDVSATASTSLAGSKFSIYRHSSELLHGTYFGVIYFWTSPSGGQLDRNQFEDQWVHNHFVTVFTAAFFGVIGAIECCSSRFEFEHYSDATQQMIKRTKELLDLETLT